MVVKPVSTARMASSGRQTPLTAEGPFHSPRSHSASFQSNSGAIWLLTKEARESAGTSRVLGDDSVFGRVFEMM